MRPYLVGTVFFRTALPCSGGYHLESGGLPLHNAVKTTATENQGTDVKYMGQGVYVGDCVCVV